MNTKRQRDVSRVSPRSVNELMKLWSEAGSLVPRDQGQPTKMRHLFRDAEQMLENSRLDGAV